MSKQRPEFDAIEEAANAAVESQDRFSDEQRIQALEERIAGIEPLLEQLQANSAIGPELSKYVNDLRDEQVFFNYARYAVGALALVAILAIASLLAVAILHSASPLLKAPATAIAAVVVGLVSGIVFLISAFVKGIFRSTTERHADGFLPPALKEASEFLAKVVGGKSSGP